MTFYNPKAIEQEIQAIWKEHRIPEKAVAVDPERKKFYLLDGPPYVNYTPHVGHIKTTTLKDVWGKFKRMQGFSVWFQPGFDCSGLPIENAVEKKLGISSKRDIERLGVDRFIAECKSLAEANKPLWLETYRRLAAWRGWIDPYLTYTNDYLESGWWSIKQIAEKGLLIEGERSGFWCTHCETVLAGYEVTDSYKTVQDPSITVKFPVRGEPGTFLLVWTTTPWTLPSNVAIAVHPQETYTKVRVGQEILILAEKRLSVLDEIGLSYQVIDHLKGTSLEGLAYHGVVDTPLQKEMDAKAHKVIHSIKLLKKRAASKVSTGEDVFEDFVTMDTGTGLVHTAPGLGDAKVGEHYRLPALSPVDDRGCFTADAGKYQGQYVKKADQAIIADLRATGLLLHAGTVSHPYPLCWRCKTPLIYRMSKQWFVQVGSLRQKMLKENKKVRWLPPFARERFHEVLETAPDWAVTRQRYWGIPLPVWVCASCHSQKVVGSVKELREHAEQKLPDRIDLHKDVVDAIALKCHCGGHMERVKDILDVWFDSGIAPWASLGYPFRNKALFERLWPVDLVDESQDQTRGWFYTLMTCGHAVMGQTPYRTVCLNGWTLDEKGEKMSKSVGNVVTAAAGLDQLGADLLRLYSCTEVAPWETQKFSLRSAKDLERGLNVLWNAALFAKTYGGSGSPRGLLPEDRWILSRVNTLTKTMTTQLDRFEFHLAGRGLVDFILNDLSRWYIKIIRDRTSPFYTGKDKQAAIYALQTVLERVSLLLAPICPFLAEKIYRDLTGKESVHLAAWPRSGKTDQVLEKQMDAAKRAVEAVHALRAERNMKLRWPIDTALVHSSVNLQGLEQVIKAMGNVKAVTLSATPEGKAFDGGAVQLGNVIPEEALVREVIRKAQDLRKQAQLQVSEQLPGLYIATDPKTQAALEGYASEIAANTGASRVAFEKKKTRGTIDVDGATVEIGF